MFQLGSIKHIKVTWVFEDEVYFYENVSGSLVSNSKAKTIRFELRELYGEDDNFQVIIKKDEDSYVFKTDYYEDEKLTLGLKEFVGLDEAILYHEGPRGCVYFHLFH